MLLKMAWASLLHRRTTVLLTLFSLSISVMMVLGIEHIRTQAKASFAQTVSGTDLIVGARSGRINLLLYSVFRMGNATSNISWESYQHIAQQKGVKWTIPLSLGDSHKGYRVLGTTPDYFTHYRYGKKQALSFNTGAPFRHTYDVVLGAEVAEKLGYTLQDTIILSHGTTKISFTQHDNDPFKVVGILQATGTPVDQTLHISLAGMTAIHIGWEENLPGRKTSADNTVQHYDELTPKSITAFMLGLNNRIMTFRLQRNINQYSDEALMAILPGVALSELWQTMSVMEKTLSLIAALTVIASLLGMTTMMLASLQQRQREVSILRAIGAPAWTILCLIEFEVILISLFGALLGIAFLWIGLLLGKPLLVDSYGLFISTTPFSLTTLWYTLSVVGIAMLLALIPAVIAYRQSLAQGLSIRM